MTLRKFLIWYLGVVLFVGTAGASGYRMLVRQHVQAAASEAAVQPADVGAPVETAAAEPGVAGDGLPEVAPAPHRQVAAAPHPVPAVRKHVATAGVGHAAPPAKLAERRAVTPAVGARPAHRAVAQAGPPPVGSQYAAPAQPAWAYAQPPAPVVTYYAYPGYAAYPRGYAYYYPRVQYYRVY